MIGLRGSCALLDFAISGGHFHDKHCLGSEALWKIGFYEWSVVHMALEGRLSTLIYTMNLKNHFRFSRKRHYALNAISFAQR